MKECFKCKKIKPLNEFYKHRYMKGGHVNKCKPCNKLDNKINRKNKVENYRLYDRARGNRQSKEYSKEWRIRNPAKYKSQTLIGNMIRSGKLIRQSCEECGELKTHAHHDDYLKPFNVRWLCAAHHSQWHIINGEGKNGQSNLGNYGINSINDAPF